MHFFGMTHPAVLFAAHVPEVGGRAAAGHDNRAAGGNRRADGRHSHGDQRPQADGAMIPAVGAQLYEKAKLLCINDYVINKKLCHK